jgi:penicillin-binding protein 2
MRNSFESYNSLKSYESSDAKQVFSRRSFLMAGVQALLMTGLVGRLFYLGVKRAAHYRTLADENRIKLQILLPERGLIYDRCGQILADNQTNYRLVLLPGFKRNLHDTLLAIESLIGLGGYRIDELVEEIKKNRPFTPFTLRQNLTWEEVCQIEVNALSLPGIAIEKGRQRFYPARAQTAHLIGYIQAPTEEDDVEKHFLHLPDFRLGKAGLEKEFDEVLRGQAGYKEIEVNAVRKVVRELSVNPSKSGYPLNLTIDIRLQAFIAQKLAEYESAAVVVMDVHTGEIYALVSSPSFDPNVFTNGIRSQEWKRLIENPYGIMNNKTINGLYAPGSTFKMVVGLAALASGKITANHKIFCSGLTEVNGHRYHCWIHKHGHGHGPMSFVDALRESCDVYFYEIAKLIGHEAIAEMAKRFGFGQKTGIQLPGEKEGLVPGRSWKFLKHRAKWTVGDTILMSIGQGYMLATPLQLAVMTARLTNGGQVVHPTLLKHDIRGIKSALKLPTHFLDLVIDGMNQVVNHPRGTAIASRILNPAYAMGGKTGTSQVRRISLKERRQRVLQNEELRWQERDHSLFVACAPIHAPKFALSVVVEHGGAGAKVAAGIARDILEFAQKLEFAA